MKKVKVLRVVTNSTVVPWHLKNTLNHHRSDENFEVLVVGDDVERFSSDFPHVKFINWHVERKPNILKDIHSLFKLIKIINQVEPDIVHSLMPKASFLACIASLVACVPIRIHTFTGQMWNLDLNYKKNYLYWFDRLVFKLNTLCLTDSPSQCDFLLEHGFVSKNKNLSCLGSGSLSGVDLSTKKYDESVVNQLKEKYSLDGKFVCLFLARKNEEKGAFFTLDIFNKFNIDNNENGVLFFIGPDNSSGYLSSLRKNSPNLFDNVIELDSVNNPFDYIKCSHILILPSLREGFGSVVIDAASVGVPTIGTNIVGLRDAISNGKTGILFETKSRVQAINALQFLYSSQEVYLEFSNNCKERANELFDSTYVHNELISLYRKLLNRI